MIILLLSLWSTAAAQSVPTISLKQAVQIAVEKSPDLQIAKNQWQASGLEQKNAFVSFFPSVDLSAGHGLRGLTPDPAGVTAQTNWVSGATVSVTENFYDNGEGFKKYRISSLRYELAQIGYERTKAQVLRSVALAFYRFNISAQNLKFAVKNLQELDRLAKLVTNQFQQGLKTRKDFLSFKTRAQRSQLDVYRAEQSLARDRGVLMSLLGISPTEPVQFDSEQKPVLSKVPLRVDFPSEQLYELRVLRLLEQIRDHEINLSERRNWPELNLVGALSYGSSEYVNTGRSFADNDVTQWNVLFNVKFNLVDWGVRHRNIQLTRINQNSLQQSQRSLLLAAEKDLEVYRAEVLRSNETYRLAKELQKMEEDTFRFLESDYRSGRATYLELTTGLANLLDAQNRGQEADFDQADLYLRSKYYKGTLNETTVLE